jgi:caffeoyl-CoA O-methyltransferase
MSFIVPEEIEAYAEAHTTPHADLLARLAEETRATLERPQMLTGPIEGRFLEFLVWTTGARRILELGTYSGYSSISMAAALREDGRIDTCEVDEAHAEVARRYIAEAGLTDRITIHLGPALESIGRLEGAFDTCEVEERFAEVASRYIAEAGYEDRITVHLGPALDTIATLEGDFDFVFIDADKENYVNYYEAVLPRLSERGFIAADNTLWSGRVIDEADDSEATQAIRGFNDHVRDDPRVVSVMLSVRDGVTLIRRAD